MPRATTSLTWPQLSRANCMISPFLLELLAIVGVMWHHNKSRDLRYPIVTPREGASGEGAHDDFDRKAQARGEAA